jgi:hypothetical protein
MWWWFMFVIKHGTNDGVQSKHDYANSSYHKFHSALGGFDLSIVISVIDTWLENFGHRIQSNLLPQKVR